LALCVTGSGCLYHIGGFIPPHPHWAALPLTAAAFHSEYPLAVPIPVSPASTWEIEEAHWRKDKDMVPILGPIKGEFAPVFCMDPPSDELIYKSLPPIPHGVPFIYEVQRTNVRISKEKLVDKVDPCRFYPLVGPAQLHHCHWKCTIWYDEIVTMGWPIPWTKTTHKQEVIYIDKDHLHRCGDPGSLAGAGGPSSFARY
jgi:hypothetical protein